MAAPSRQASDPPSLTVVVDYRERPSGLTDAVLTRWPCTAEAKLLVGDVQIGSRVIVERKTLPDFAASLRDRRLFRQAYGLSRVASRPLMLLEGAEPAAVLGLHPTQLHGVLLTLMISFRIPVLRTSTVSESAAVIARIALHEARWMARRATELPVPIARQALDVLTSIPGIGDERARHLLNAYGSVAGVVAADLRELQRLAGIGPETARKLRSTLGTADIAVRPPAPPST
jgi:ERCC4-type nuclease